MRFFKNKLAVTIVVLSVGFLALIGYSAKDKNVPFIKEGLGTPINYAQGFIYGVTDKSRDFVYFILNFNNIRKENETLKKQNDELQSKALQFDSMLNENERLREMLNFKNQRSEYDYVGADIIGKSGGSFLDGYVINKGTKDGIMKGMVVITAQGLVGQVTSCEKSWSIVQSLANENIAVGAMVESTRENQCIIKGYRDRNNRQLAKLYYLPLESNIKKDDVILTSGLGGLYPKDIKIGYVIDIEEDKGKVMKIATIQPYVDLNRLEEVFVVIPKDKRQLKY